MQDRLTPLIQERAPWLFSNMPGTLPLRALLNRMLRYDRTVALALALRDMPSYQIMATLADMLARDVEVSGLGHIPNHGTALIVANHPTGIADGIILNHLIAGVRPDAYFFANHDILRVLPQMQDMIVPVEWHADQGSHAKIHETMEFTRTAVQAGRLGVIFPAGRLAKRRGLSLHERPWMADAAMIARKFDLPVIPVNIRARNSALFYLFDLVHPSLRDIALLHETLNKDQQPYRVTVGEAISAAALPARTDEAIAMLRRAALSLGGARAPVVSLLDTSRHAAWRRP